MKLKDPQKAGYTHHKSITSLLGASWSYLPSPVYNSNNVRQGDDHFLASDASLAGTQCSSQTLLTHSDDNDGRNKLLRTFFFVSLVTTRKICGKHNFTVTVLLYLQTECTDYELKNRVPYINCSLNQIS